MNRRITGSRLRATAVVPAVAMVAAGFAAASTSASVAAAPADASTRAKVETSRTYINYAAPRAETAFGTDVELSTNPKQQAKTAKAQQAAIERALANDRKHAEGNPVAAKQLAKDEATAIRTGKSPKAIKKARKGAKNVHEAKLLTILVEFNENANDDFTGLQVPTEFGATTCKPGNVQNGPLHNNIPNPAEGDYPDNNSMWLDDFSSEHFNTMLFTKKGITERVRPDLTGPDGKRGIDISGYTMKNMYEEMSRGAYTVTGAATPWVKVGHSEAWYGATVCHPNDEGVMVAGPMQDMQGHPDNPLGAGQLPIDAVTALAQAQPDFPWTDYDVEDQGDKDGDGNVNEPDGVIDHVVLIHAGADKSGGGGAEGTYAIWAHSSDVAGGAPVPGTSLKLSNYIVQPEDSGVGVFAHEYGHDLGLPDLYDTSGAAESDIDFWDLMSSGSHSGPIFQSMPTHMGIWDKWVLGWADPVEINVGDAKAAYRLGQSSRPQNNTVDGLKINLPDKAVTLATPHSGEGMWWSGDEQSWADNKISRTVEVPAGSSEARFWMWNDYVIEEDWDMGFVEVSTDGGSSWTESKVFDESGAEVTTPDGYADPNGRMADYGGKKYGLTGTTDGFAHQYVDLTAYAGQSVQVRLRYATDAAFQERGWFADDFSLTDSGTVIWSDDVEGTDNAGWTLTRGTWTDTSGEGWRKDGGTHINPQFYMVEWRNFDGFDEGLKYAYDTTYQTADGSWKVEKIKYNAPGALVWYRDASMGNVNHVTANLTSLPSSGAKGQLLLVDSHFDPLRRSGAAAQLDPSVLKNLPSRPQSSNAAFGIQPTWAFRECVTDAAVNEVCNTHPPQAPVSTFTDSQGWVPGIEVRDDGFYFRDADASTVVPSRDIAPYTTRIVNPDGSPATDYYGLDFGFPEVTGSGNPADSGVDFGTVVKVLQTFGNNKAAQVVVTPPSP